MKKSIFFLLLAPFVTLAENSFLVAPGVVEFDLTKPATQSFIITNDGDEPIRLNINPIYLDIGDSSLAMGEHLSPDTKETENITKNLRVSPKRLSLKPGQRRDIRVSFRPNKDITDGDYRTHLLVQMLETAKVIDAGTAGDGALGMKIDIKMETAVAIYGRKGEGSAVLDFQCIANEEDGNLIVTTINESEWRFEGQLTIVNQSQPGEPVYDDRVVSLRGSKRDIKIAKPFQQGTYQLTYSELTTPDVKTNIDCKSA